MATGFSSSFQNASDFEYDYNCTRCEETGYNSEALFYCNDCSKLFCDKCVQLHGNFFTDHNVLDKSKVKKWGAIQKHRMSPKCDEHKGEELKMFCFDHDMVCCTVCVSAKHSSCKKVDYISKMAKGIHKKPRFNRSKKNHTDQQDTCKGIISLLKQLTKKFIEFINQIEKQTIEEMDNIFANLDGSIDACTALLDKQAKGQPDASKVRAYGPGLEHGIHATYESRFIVETRGAGAGQLTVRIRGPKGAFRIEMCRDHQKDRTILCRFDPKDCGLYILSVKWSGVDVPGSPFHVHILDTQEELEEVHKK